MFNDVEAMYTARNMVESYMRAVDPQSDEEIENAAKVLGDVLAGAVENCLGTDAAKVVMLRTALPYLDAIGGTH